ncbi:unnamed protein product [Candida verbasci]|uniref:DNA-directed RNA polymerase III subunit RPC4 n=1 Tax=Candida verbasci TaxID=1227364 RepID=A0A9W4XBH2_9ASCO|nr:unnamed protein product [Candida verbasci]
MSNRLESLNSSKKPSASPTPKTTLKFKPKVVQRKSKEERDKAAPQVKVEHDLPKPSSSRGRGGARGGRGRGGRNNYAGTHLVTSGPLSAGSVSIGNPNGSKFGFTKDTLHNSNEDASTQNEFISNLKLKDKPKKEVIDKYEDEDDEEEDKMKINMTKPYKFDDSETVLFPMRPYRDDGIRRETYQQPGVPLDDRLDSKESTPNIISLTQSREATIRSEQIEDKLNQIKENKAKLESKISQNDPIIVDEANKLISDHQEILDLLTGKFQELNTNEDDDKYVFFQLPRLLPEYQNPVKPEDEEMVEDKPTDTEEVKYSTLSNNKSKIRGEIGKINIHQSGKISIDLGNGNKLNVTKGAPSDFLQELVLIDLVPKSTIKKQKDEEGEENDEDVEMLNEHGKKVAGKVLRLGTVNEKIVTTPYIP